MLHRSLRRTTGDSCSPGLERAERISQQRLSRLDEQGHFEPRGSHVVRESLAFSADTRRVERHRVRRLVQQLHEDYVLLW